MTDICVTPEQWINIALTVVIAVAVGAQAWFTRQQARLLKASDRWARERESPTLRIVPLAHRIGRVGPSGDLTTKSFDGFTVTNSGFRDLEITSFAFETGRVLDGDEDAHTTAEIVFAPVELSTMSLPHRLRPGESFTILHDRMKLVEESTRIGGETPVHMRPYCRDSLGNKHMPYHWMIYKKGETVFVDGPSPGRISEDELGQLKPAKRRRISSWSQRQIGP